jgi:hypothetical protein
VRYGEIVGLYTEVERLRESRLAIAEQLIAAQVMVDAARAEQGPNRPCAGHVESCPTRS